MPDRLPTIWDIDPHTKAKHFILKRPLGGGFPILSRWQVLEHNGGVRATANPNGLEPDPVGVRTDPLRPLRSLQNGVHLAGLGWRLFDAIPLVRTRSRERTIRGTNASWSKYEPGDLDRRSFDPVL